MRFLSVLCLLFLTACSVLPHHAKDEFVLKRQGRVALTVTDLNTQARESNNALFVWQLRSDGGYRLTLKSLIGTTLFELDQRVDGVSIYTYSGQRYHPADAEAFLADTLNMPIPIHHLSAIFKGEVSLPNAHYVYQGWEMNVSRFDKTMPIRFSLQRDQGAKHIQLKVVVSS